MKINKLKYCTVVLLMFTVLNISQAQETQRSYKETMEMKAEENGDIVVNSSIKFIASAWEGVKQRRGNEPSILKNELKKRFPKYVLTDFDIKTDDMERTVNIKFKILGLLKLDDSGKWIAELDSKNPDITKVSDNQFLMVDEGSAQTSKIILPSSASNSKIEKDSFGKAILTYTAPVSGGGMGNIIKYLGFLVAAGGAFLFFKGRKLNTVVVNDPKNQKIDYHKTNKIEDAVIINQPAKESSKPGQNEQSNNDKY